MSNQLRGNEVTLGAMVAIIIGAVTLVGGAFGMVALVGWLTK